MKPYCEHKLTQEENSIVEEALCFATCNYPYQDQAELDAVNKVLDKFHNPKMIYGSKSRKTYTMEEVVMRAEEIGLPGARDDLNFIRKYEFTEIKGSIELLCEVLCLLKSAIDYGQSIKEYNKGQSLKEFSNV